MDDNKRVMNAALEELEAQRRIITKLEIENDELKKKIKDLLKEKELK
jgi:hypothetical protein